MNKAKYCRKKGTYSNKCKTTNWHEELWAQGIGPLPANSNPRIFGNTFDSTFF